MTLALEQTRTSSTLSLTLAPEARSAFSWLKNFADESGISRQELAANLAYDESTISKIFTQSYRGNPSHIIVAIEKYRTSLISRIESAAEFPFIESAVAKTIHSYIDLVVKWRKIGTIIGESQTGKTRALKQYKNEKRKIVFLRLPPGGHRSKTVLRLCKLLGVSDGYNTPKREERVLNVVTRDHVILVDELQQCAARQMAGGRIGAERVDTIEFLRDLKDETGCSMIFSGTTEALRMLTGTNDGFSVGHTNGHILIQTLKRSLDPLVLKNNPPKRDLDTYARKIGLDPADDHAVVYQTKDDKGKVIKSFTMKALQDDLVVVRGLEIWLTYLLAGAEIASGHGRSVTWDDIVEAHAIFTGGQK